MGSILRCVTYHETVVGVVIIIDTRLKNANQPGRSALREGKNGHWGKILKGIYSYPLSLRIQHICYVWISDGCHSHKAGLDQSHKSIPRDE